MSRAFSRGLTITQMSVLKRQMSVLKRQMSVLKRSLESIMLPCDPTWRKSNSQDELDCKLNVRNSICTNFRCSAVRNHKQSLSAS